MHNVQVSAIGGGMPPHGKRSVTITVELPDELADEAEALQAADPAFLPRAVLYGLTRRVVYRHLREAGKGRNIDELVS